MRTYETLEVLWSAAMAVPAAAFSPVTATVATVEFDAGSAIVSLEQRRALAPFGDGRLRSRPPCAVIKPAGTVPEERDRREALMQARASALRALLIAGGLDPDCVCVDYGPVAFRSMRPFRDIDIPVAVIVGLLHDPRQQLPAPPIRGPTPGGR